MPVVLHLVEPNASYLAARAPRSTLARTDLRPLTLPSPPPGGEGTTRLPLPPPRGEGTTRLPLPPPRGRGTTRLPPPSCGDGGIDTAPSPSERERAGVRVPHEFTPNPGQAKRRRKRR